MRYSQGIEIAENKTEFLPMVKRPKVVRKVEKKTKRGERRKGDIKYYNVTCAFDIETTNNDADGFAYSFQMCIGGAVVVPRYFEDWVDILEALVDKWGITTKERLVLYVHNLGYEYTYLIQMLCNRWGDCKALYTKSRKPLYLLFDNGIEFRDSLKLFQKSLARATEGCKHEKLKGDLDYTVYRTPDTPLTDIEFAYCVNDVLGLWEAIERLKSEHNYNAASIPMTNTAMVVQEVNSKISHDTKCRNAMARLHLSKNQTRLAYLAMAGGDTHGTRWRAGYTYTGCNSYDFKSAHPSQQLLWKFPSGKPFNLPDETPKEDMERLIRAGFGWVAKILLIDFSIRPDCPDPCISVSKCATIDGETGVDNGRLLGAHGAFIYCDSNDWQRIREGYTFKKMVAMESFAFQLDYLPDSFRETILEKFKIKETMKGSPEYAFSKICVNTIYGATAQKQVRDEYDAKIDDAIEFTCIHWEKTLEEMDEKQVDKKQAEKFPFLWGLWTASMTRFKLWQLLKIVGWDRVIYWDTDSCKYQGAKCPGVDEYNAEVKAQCERRGVVVTKASGKNVYIGVAEDEHPGAEYGYTEFRFLHAKCYAARTCDGVLESTIAGVGKKEGQDALKDDIDNLDDFLIIENAGGQMLTYHDSPIKVRNDFEKPTISASWVVMTPRRYEVGGVNEFTEERLG